MAATGDPAAQLSEILSTEGVAEALASPSGVALADLLGETTELGKQEFVTRVLRACDNVIPKAAHVLITILKWREEQNLPGILDDDFSKRLIQRAAAYWPVGFAHGAADDGCVVEVWRVGQFWPTEFLQFLTTSEIRTQWLMHMEAGIQKQAEVRKRLSLPAVSGCILIFDLAGLTRRHLYPAGIRELTDTLAVSQRYYVENVRSIFVVNAGKVFETAWKIIRKTLSPNTVAKVSVHADSGLDALTKRIGSVEKIPAFLGGRDETSKIGNVLHVGEGEVLVKAGTTHFVVIEESEIPEGETTPVLEVMFETEDYDIDFGVLWYPADGPKGKEVELLPFKKYNSHVALEKVEVPLPGRGVLRLAFDNEEAMFKGKKVFVNHQWRTSSTLSPEKEKNEAAEGAGYSAETPPAAAAG